MKKSKIVFEWVGNNSSGYFIKATITHKGKTIQKESASVAPLLKYLEKFEGAI
jgi:hypothetical protein